VTEGAHSGWTPLIVTVAPNGARKTKRDHPRLPIAPAEIAREARAALEAGAAMLHLHVRDDDGRHTLDPDAYRAAIAAVGAEVGERMVVQVTTEAVGRFTPEEQMAAVRALKPEAVSLAVRELIPAADNETVAAAFLQWCRREAVATQHILYDVADLHRFEDLVRRGIVPERHPFRLYVLGRYHPPTTGEPADLVPLVARDDGRDDPWAVCAFGPKEAACATVAAGLGGHVRVGFENNLQLPGGSIADSNADLVAAVADAARLLGRPLADADGLRAAVATWR
jgi:3-keto-5-aminohexanoate cleavage enzyme